MKLIILINYISKNKEKLKVYCNEGGFLKKESKVVC